MEELSEISKPNVQSLTNQQILYGMAITIPAIELLTLFSDTEFERFIQEWATGYLLEIVGYKKVYRNAGAGDKGRDVVACHDESGEKWDCYQCKHYDHPLTPSDVWVEFGKLCYYTFHNEFTVPQKYIFATSKGVGPLLKSYIQNPEQLKNNLILNWEKHCKNKITDTGIVELTEELKGYVEKFDFKIVGFLDPLEVIEQHRKTPYYVPRFGGGFNKFREQAITPEEIQESELTYVTKLLEAYSEDKGVTFNNTEELMSYNIYKNHFQRERIHYHKAQSLASFERDTLPEGADAFAKLKNSVFMGVIDTVESDFSSGFARVKEVTKTARSLQLSGNPLISVVEDDDRHGICHHLANDGLIEWVRKNE
ncbi:ABC-three component system protein [Paenibacillus polymyxa]|uniref:ABC-three component system protein n=1 Tax=Paenibacillus polymyxa TaxID=1406 RepID=UPI0023787A43|nr:ABC-three component system protein [Paenibacillus polymyxa]WDM21263.1 restriction endonuclease [Paenibacillus polymyxa]